MKKWVLVISLVFISLNSLASNLSSTRIQPPVMNALKPFSSISVMGSALPMIYSGQDVSRPSVAVANESLWAGQRTMIG